MNLLRWLLLGVGVFCVLSCDRPKDTSNEFGDITSPEQIQKAQSDAIATLSPNSVEVGQRVHGIETQEVLTTQGPLQNLVSEWQTEVTEKEDFDDYVLFTLHRRVIDHGETDKPIYDFKHIVGFAKTETRTPQDVKDLSLSYKLFSSDTPAAKSDKIEILDVTFHNLQNKMITVAPPTPRSPKRRLPRALSL